jgi:imidazoleglycerol phosphate dehydratase HisB/histidinol-phosphate/aromatic aminotransferase/cobyric acid decarboxylase-like protein
MTAPADLTAALRPVPQLEGVGAYGVPRSGAPMDLRLDGNEGLPAPADLLDLLAGADPQAARGYPDDAPLRRLLAARLGVDPACVLVTAGADDGLDRACRAVLAPGRELILPAPTFEMLGRYAELTGASVRTVPWAEGPYPQQAVLAAVGPETAAIAVVSPNNPTGAVAGAADLRALAEAAPGALLLVDGAYEEFADESLTLAALELENAVVFRTLSKAWGLAGLRIGYAVGAPRVIGWLAAAGHPYAVSGLSLALAEARLRQPGVDGEVRAFVDRVRVERSQLRELLDRLGLRALPSQGNFVMARLADPVALRDALAADGIAIRVWPGHALLGDATRITCPGDPLSFERLTRALRAAHGEEVEPLEPTPAPEPVTRSAAGAGRVGRVTRRTGETEVVVRVDLDGSGTARVETGVGFLDHMLSALARHARLDLDLVCRGDLQVDDHHTAEDCALALGQALNQALGERRGIARFGWALAPLDEALARVSLDLSGRPWAEVSLDLRREALGGLATENVGHVLRSLATTLQATLHVDLVRGENDHHKAEAAFKALALALRQAVARDGTDVVPSTKGVL